MRKISLSGHFCPRSLAFKHFLLTARTLFLLFTIVTSSVYAFPQQNGNTVTGTVKDSDGLEVIGANVVVKGTTNGTITNFNGEFTLNNVNINAVILVSYIGYNQQEVVYTGQPLAIVLVEDALAIDEVVVTALGIKRDRKSLGYALSEVKGDALTQTRDANVANALSGKVAGLQVKQASTGVAGSSRIVLRGNNSIGGNNQPLIVVDGIPINSETGGSDDLWGNKNIDCGGGMSDISPDDIETISVLKGPAAAALYGSRAGNGVIMITTKKGQGKKGVGISFNSNFTFENPLTMPKFQNEYGQGENGVYGQNAKYSWGERMTGQQRKDLGGRDVIYSPDNNDLEDFLRTGTTWTNSLELTSSTDKNSVRVGIMNLNNKAVVPNSDFNKTSFTVRGTANLTNKLSLDSKITYINQKTNNRIKLTGDPDNIFYNYLLMPRSIHFSDLAAYPGNAYPNNTINPVSGANMSGGVVRWSDGISGAVLNPYWATQNNTNSDRKHRFIGFASLKYEFTDWLNIQGRYGMDYQSAQYKDKMGTGVHYWTTSGDYSMTKEDFYEINTDFLITFNKQIAEDFGLVATAGGNIMYRRNEGLTSQTNGLIIPNFFTMRNGVMPKTHDYMTRKQTNSLYATTSASWRNMLYLDLTARNDWTSSLNPDNRSYFYPSVSGSWLFTETFKKLTFLNYGKLRVSWAQVGNDTDPYSLYNYRELNTSYVVNESTGQIETVLQGLKSDTRALYNLKNETINSYEIGLELKAFNNRLGLDIAYYNKEAKNQILKMNTPPSTGYSYRNINAGNVRNRGIEVLLTGTPVQTKDFTWDIALNFSKNENKILELADGIQRQELQHSSLNSTLRIVAEVGGSYGDILGRTLNRNENGELIVDKDGLPEYGSEYVKLGNNSPDWMGGLSNTFTYKGFDLSFQIDMRYGGDVYMGSIRTGSESGILTSTLEGRESMLIEGVTADGTKNSVATTAQKYWTRLAEGAEPWIYDATNIRLRELSLGYTLPKNLLRRTPFQNVKLSFVGRNLWLIHSKTKGFDPEGSASTGNAQGFEFASMPIMRSLGFNLNVTF